MCKKSTIVPSQPRMGYLLSTNCLKLMRYDEKIVEENYR